MRAAARSNLDVLRPLGHALLNLRAGLHDLALPLRQLVRARCNTAVSRARSACRARGCLAAWRRRAWSCRCESLSATGVSDIAAEKYLNRMPPRRDLVGRFRRFGRDWRSRPRASVGAARPSSRTSACRSTTRPGRLRLPRRAVFGVPNGAGRAGWVSGCSDTECRRQRGEPSASHDEIPP